MSDSPFAVNADVKVAVMEKSEKLYSYVVHNERRETLRLLPYFSWANCGKTDMRVWFAREY